MTSRRRNPVADYLQRAPSATLNLYAMTAAFATYFCMYAFRKPFSAGVYQGYSFFGTQVELKTALVISQIIGYALSKYLGVKICPEVTRRSRPWMLAGLVAAAELALVFFAVAPKNLKVFAIFLNGLPLGMVWGLVVWYLEGRRSSEILLAVLSCSFIVSSGAVKDVGRALTAGVVLGGAGSAWQLPPVDEFWMPAVTGLLFLGPFLAAVWLLDQIPDPSPTDAAERSPRVTMTVKDRLAFVRRYFVGLALLVTAYVLLTAYRDFRDNYAVDVLIEMGLEDRVAAISSMETIVAFGVLVAMAMIYFIEDNRRAMLAIFAIVAGGLLLVGLATAMQQRGMISSYAWLTAVGLGSYLAYVPYNSVMFDRMMASTRAIGTAVFAIYVADALGYTGSVVVLLLKDLLVGDVSRMQFLQSMSYLVAGVGAVLVALGGAYFLRQGLAPSPAAAPLHKSSTSVS